MILRFGGGLLEAYSFDPPTHWRPFNWVGVEQGRLGEVTEIEWLTLSSRPILLGGMQQSDHLVCKRV